MAKQVKVDALKLAGGVISVKSVGKCPSKAAFAIWKMYDNGSSYDVIASAKGIPIERVKRIVATTDRYINANSELTDVCVLKAQQHIQLQSMINEAKKAWKKSKGEKRKIVRKYDQLGTMTEESETVEQGGGDIEYLNAMAKFMKEQREIWPGANAPKAQAITNADGTGDAKVLVETWQDRIRNMPADQRVILFSAIEGVATQPSPQRPLL